MGNADGKYYRKDNNSLVQMAEADTISDTGTDKYRKDSLTEVYKTDASGYMNQSIKVDTKNIIF